MNAKRKEYEINMVSGGLFRLARLLDGEITKEDKEFIVRSLVAYGIKLKKLSAQ